MPKKQKLIKNLKILEEEFGDSGDESAAVGQMVDVNFEGFTAQPDDFHGITRLLAQTFKGLEVNLTDVADAIIEQNIVGSVIKEVIDEEDEAMDVDKNALEGQPDEEGDYIFGLNTVLNVTTRKNGTFHEKICSELEKKCKGSSASEDVQKKFSALIEDKEAHVGLLVNERLVNLPCEVALPAFTNLQLEVEEANKLSLPFKFKYVVLICKLYKIKTLKMKKKERKEKAETDGSASKSLKEKEVYGNAEEEIFAEFSEASFEYNVQDCNYLGANSWNENEASQKNVTEFRRVLIIPADKMELAVSKAIAAAAPSPSSNQSVSMDE